MIKKYIPVLENEVVLLRSWQTKYAKDFLRLLSDSEIARAAGVKAIPNLKSAKALIKMLSNRNGLEWSIALKMESEPEIIGYIGVSDAVSVRGYKNLKEIGYLIDEKYWGNGYAGRAVNLVVDYCFQVLDSEAIVIVTEDTNHRSIRVAEKCGFSFLLRKCGKSVYARIREQE